MTPTNTEDGVDDLIAAQVTAAEERLKAEIAQAIGYAQGTGYPNKYLESRYPELLEAHRQRKE